MYLQADLAIKERAVQKVTPLGGQFSKFRTDDKLLAFLNSL